MNMKKIQDLERGMTPGFELPSNWGSAQFVTYFENRISILERSPKLHSRIQPGSLFHRLMPG